MSTIKFRLAAKTDVGLVRTNNEDNFQVAADLSAAQMRWVNNEVCSLGDKGALLVVADGMGGMNAGEVASELAIETVRSYFSPENLTSEITKNRFSIEKYMNDVIVAADARIKQEAREHPESKGMGTTIVIGWLLDGKLYVSWCGDSRAYVYNPDAGLHQISKDHSYVQSLVDKGAISREDAFDFPDSNIITRSLCDASTKAKPESLLKPYTLCDNDIILLCTDGLNGMIRDHEIEMVIRNNEHNMDVLVDELIHAACEAEGSDNVTICLCQILQGGQVCNPTVFEESDNRLNGGRNNIVRTLIDGGGNVKPAKTRLFVIIACIAMILLAMSVLYFTGHLGQRDAENIQPADSTEMNRPVQPEEMQTPNEQSEAAEPATEKADTPDQKQVGKNKDKKRNPEPKAPSHVLEETPEPPTDDIDQDVITPVGNLNDDVKKVVEEPVEEPTEREAETQVYDVMKGDTYYSLAAKFNTNVDLLKQLNGNKELKAGDRIVVPIRK